MKQLTCLQCGGIFILDPTPESEAQKHIKRTTINGTLCRKCSQVKIQQLPQCAEREDKCTQEIADQI